MRYAYLILALMASACHAPETSEAQPEYTPEYSEGSQDASWAFEMNSDDPGVVWSIDLQVSRPVQMLRLANGKVISLGGENLCAVWARDAIERLAAANEAGEFEMTAASIEAYLRGAVSDPRAEVRVVVSQRDGRAPYGELEQMIGLSGRPK
ncbi:MAG: hypothetical protein CMJ94_13525 [Planctomycetes bacterium]|nr:hypothetical protein [Planctomycetota bacterium]